MKKNISKELLDYRRLSLENVEKRLKNEFVGIDDTISELIEKIKTWWCYVEFQTRPTIINLYGMTGVGKTDLIRKLALYLGYGDKLCVVNMDSGYGSIASNYQESNDGDKRIVNRLQYLKIKRSERAILLLDEFHRFSSVSKEKMSGIVHGSSYYEDVWPLLSDGEIYDRSDGLLFLKEEIEYIKKDIFKRSIVSYQDRYVADKIMNINNRVGSGDFEADKGGIPLVATDGVKALLNPVRKLYMWSYTKFFEFTDKDKELIWNLAFQEASMNGDYQKYTTLNNQYYSKEILSDLEKEILNSLGQQAQLFFLNTKLQTVENNVEIDGDKDIRPYSRLLIFIVANLDNVFLQEKQMTRDSDGLLLHYKKPSLSDVKEELGKLFRPEQVSRLGHNFIFANPILAENMKQLCFKEIDKYESIMLEQYDIVVKFYKDSFWSVVKKEGLNGKDGVRPLYSSIMNVMGEEIPKILALANDNKSRNITWQHPNNIQIVKT